MKKFNFRNLGLGIESILSMQELKKITGGYSSGSCNDSSCTLGSQCFYTCIDGCGIATVVGGGNGNCQYQVHITSDPPCGWA